MEDQKRWPLGRLLLVSLSLCGAAFVVAGWGHYTRQREVLKSSALAELTAIADVKAKQLSNWRAERLGDGSVLSSALPISRARRILSNGGSPQDRVELEDLLRRFSSAFHYAGAAVVDRTGTPRLEINPGQARSEDLGAFLSSAPAAVSLSDLYRVGDAARPWMLLLIPVPDGGAMILDIDPAVFLYPYVRSWPTASVSGETILARREGNDIVYLSDGRLANRTPLWGHFPWQDFQREGNFPNPVLDGWIDYRGAAVLGVSQPIPGSTWYLITKMDRAEVNAPLRRLAWELGLALVLIAATNAAAVGLLWRNQQLRIYRAREAWFRQITNETPAYLWMTSPSPDDSFINRQFALFLGANDAPVDSLWTKYVHPNDKSRVSEELAKLAHSHIEYRDEFRLRRFDGEYRWVVAHGLPRFGARGEFAGYAGALIDITARREAEGQLRDANQALASELRERTRSEREVQALSARLIHAQEEERSRLARELHDDLSQQVAAVSIATGNLKRHLPPDSTEALERTGRIQEKLRDLAECMRRLSHELHPTVLQHFGLATALRNYCKEYAALTSHRIAFRADGPSDGIPPTTALCVYRVAQEALQNSIKHAHTDEAEVVLTRSSERICLVVSDRGAGMGPGAAGGLGLVSMKERARLVNGTLDINSEFGKGVTVTLKIPLSAAAQAGRT